MVAHSESKETINGRHSGDEVSEFSSSLKEALAESSCFKTAFSIDILVDSNEFYIISEKKI